MISASVSWLIASRYRLRPALLAEIRQEKQRAGQALFARVEELVDEVLLDPAVAGQQMGGEQLAEGRLVMQDADHLGLRHPHHFALDHGPGGRQAQRLADQAALAEELARPEQRDHRFLALLGRDDDLDPALLDVEDGVGRRSPAGRRRRPCDTPSRSGRDLPWRETSSDRRRPCRCRAWWTYRWWACRSFPWPSLCAPLRRSTIPASVDIVRKRTDGQKKVPASAFRDERLRRGVVVRIAQRRAQLGRRQGARRLRLAGLAARPAPPSCRRSPATACRSDRCRS